MGAKCSISAKAKASSDKSTVKALDGAMQTGQGAILNQMSNYALHQTQKHTTAKPVTHITQPPPKNVIKKHDLINHYLGEGLQGEAVVNVLGGHGFKIKVADVNANIKHYGTEKIPGAFAKADLNAAKLKAEAAAKQAEKALNLKPTAPDYTPAEIEEAFGLGVAPAPVVKPTLAKLSLDEQSALMEYKDNGWAVNEAIKTGKYKAETTSGAPIKEVVQDLQSAFNTGSVALEQDTVYYRGGELPSGGYVSLTTDINVAKQYGPVIEVVVPKGTRVLNVGAHVTDMESEFIVKASPSLKVKAAAAAGKPTLDSLVKGSSTPDFINKAAAAGYSEAEVVEFMTSNNFGYSPKQATELYTQTLKAANVVTTSLPEMSFSMHGGVVGYAEAMAAQGYTKDQVLAKLSKQFPGGVTSTVEGMVNEGFAHVAQSAVMVGPAKFDSGKQSLSDYVQAQAKAGFTQQQVHEALMQQVPDVVGPMAGKYIDQQFGVALGQPAINLQQVVQKQMPKFSPANETVADYAEQMAKAGYTSEQVVAQLNESNPGAQLGITLKSQIDAGFQSAGFSSAPITQPTAPPLPASQTAPATTQQVGGKAKIIQDYKDKKHDVIYKLRQAGYVGEEVVAEMSKLGYKIKITDVNANIKHYNTPKIPMSPHVAKQLSTPQLSASGKVNPKTPTTPIASKAPASGPPYERAEAVMAKKLGDAKGSNPGGLYEDPDGKKWYVKEYKNALQAPNEHLTNEVYNALGLSTPTSKVIQHADGRLSIATKYVEDTQTLAKAGLTKARAEDILDGFAADVLTANWDAVGLEYDNIIYAPGGKAMRVDQGGSLLFRAQGGLKDSHALTSSLGEWESLLKPGVNPAYARVAETAGVKRAEDIANIVEQINDIERVWLKNGKDWYGFVDQKMPQLAYGDKTTLRAVLNERTKMLIKKRDAIMSARKADAAFAELAKAPINADALVHKRLTGKEPVPVGTIKYRAQVAGQGGVDTLISLPPKVLIDTGSAEAVARWYAKYYPNVTASELKTVLQEVAQKYSALSGHVPVELIEQLQRSTLATPMTNAPVPARPGYKDGTQEAHNALRTQLKDHDTLSAGSKSAVRSYTGAGYGPLNDALRKQEMSAIEKYRAKITGMDRAMDTMKATDNVIVWRGVGDRSPLHGMSPSELQRLVDSRIEDLGYISTSVNHSTAYSFSGKRVVLRTHVPKGTRGVYVQDSALSGHSEYEFIMPRGTQMQVTHVSFDERAGVYVVDTEIVAQPRRPLDKEQAVSRGVEDDHAPKLVNTPEDMIDKMAEHVSKTMPDTTLDDLSEDELKSVAYDLGYTNVEVNHLIEHLQELYD